VVLLYDLLLHIHRLQHDLTDPVEIHRDRLADRDAMLVLLASSFATFALVRLYTRIARRRGWRGSHIGGVHVHHMVVGLVLVLAAGMVNFALSLDETGREILAMIFGVGGAFILDEFALSFHLRDVYWTEEGRRSIDASIMWLLLGLLLLVGISPFGIHDQTVVPRTIGVVIVAINIVLSLITCLKGKLTLGLLSVFVPPVGLVTAIRLARPGSIWAQLLYPPGGRKLEEAQTRFHPHESRLEHLRISLLDFFAGAPSQNSIPEGLRPELRPRTLEERAEARARQQSRPPARPPAAR
jgi:hypothetical protein